jgi:hypothetical protein
MLASVRVDDEKERTLEAYGAVWSLVVGLDIVDNNARIVALTKTLHHLLPRLVVPIDRRYTGWFFGWSTVAMQYRQEALFFEAVAAFGSVARAVDLDARLGPGWRTSPTKLIDNALVAFCLEEKPVGTRRTRTGGKYVPLREHLAATRAPVEVSFADIDRLVGGLPPSARDHREWWANTHGHTHANAWLDAGMRVDSVNLGAEWVRFVPASRSA